MKKLVIYPRGFLGFDIGLPVQRQDTSFADALKNLRYNRPTVVKSQTVVSNQMIDDVYLGLIRGERLVRSVDDYESVLTAVMDAFGTESFYEWCVMQNESPYFTDMHRRFLNDTLGFIATGRRDMEVHTWSRLLRVRPMNHIDLQTPYQYKEFFRLDLAQLFARPTSVPEIIAMWCSQPGGFMDLIGSMHIVFGDIQHN